MQLKLKLVNSYTCSLCNYQPPIESTTIIERSVANAKEIVNIFGTLKENWSGKGTKHMADRRPIANKCTLYHERTAHHESNARTKLLAFPIYFSSPPLNAALLPIKNIQRNVIGMEISDVSCNN